MLKIYRNRQFLFKILFSILLLLYIIKKVKLDPFIYTLRNTHLFYYFLSLIIYILAQPLRTLRWGIILKEKHVTENNFRLLLLYFIGMFFNTFLPGIMGGDAVRSYYVFKASQSQNFSIASVIIERLCGLVTLLLIGFVSSIWFLFSFGDSPVVRVSLSATALCLLVITFLLFPPAFNLLLRPLHSIKRWNMQEKVQDIYQSVRSFGNHRRTLLWCLLLSMVFECVIILIYYILSKSLAWGLPLYQFLYTVPIITILAIIPISFGGLGVREGICILIFSQFGIPKESALSLSLMWYSINLFTGAIGGILYPFYNVTSNFKTD